jgi:cardiolipin synthase
MKKTILTKQRNKVIKKEINYIPIRYIISIFLIIFETVQILAITFFLGIYIPYFSIVLGITEVFCILSIINSEDSPEYKIPWLLVVILIPVVGFMIYFMFYNRKLSKKYIKRLDNIHKEKESIDDSQILKELESKDKEAYLNVKLLRKLSNTHVYKNTDAKYFKLGIEMYEEMMKDLKKAQKFIYLYYFIIDEGKFWNSILEILKEKVNSGVEVRLIYDDIGCMCTLPGNYDKILKQFGIQAVPFGKLKGQANNEFNNRSHRKIMVIDGKIGYTGGVNLADEYINEKEKYGFWKDGGIKITGDAVYELTKLFSIDYHMSVKKEFDLVKPYKIENRIVNNGYVIPFGDGPRPIYKNRVSKIMIMNMLATAKEYVYMTTPYLIVDNELKEAIKNAALRGIDVRIITPHIPDKKLIFLMTRSYYKTFMDVGVKIYEYEPGFIHAKTYISDDKVGIVGTMNLDYRSLVHHFENGIYLYQHEVIKDIKEDVVNTMQESILIKQNDIKNNLFQKLVHSLISAISPIL